MDSEKHTRRAPQQARGQRRVRKILDAAAEVFAETSYEEATTNAIAIRANTSIGSLYQFFPNKLAILNALASHYRARFNAELDDLFEHPPGSLQAQLTHLTDCVSDFYAANPAFQPMFYASQSSKTLARVANETGRILEAHVSRLFVTAIPSLHPREADFYATVVVFMLRSLIPLSQTDNPLERARVIPQLKRMMFAYLASLKPFANQRFTLDE